MISFKEALNKILKQYQQAEICRMSKVNTTTLNDYLSGKIAFPTLDKAIAIAHAFELTLSQFLEEYEAFELPSRPEREIIECFRKLPNEFKGKLLDDAKFFADYCSAKEKTSRTGTEQ